MGQPARRPPAPAPLYPASHLAPPCCSRFWWSVVVVGWLAGKGCPFSAAPSLPIARPSGKPAPAGGGWRAVGSKGVNLPRRWGRRHGQPFPASRLAVFGGYLSLWVGGARRLAGRVGGRLRGRGAYPSRGQAGGGLVCCRSFGGCLSLWVGVGRAGLALQM